MRERSEDQHGVAETVKSVAPRDGFAVGTANQVGAGQRENQRQQRAPGQVKVGDQRIHRPEPVRGKDEKVGIAGARPERTGGIGAGLEHPGTGGSDGDDATPDGASTLPFAHRLFGQLKPLGVHFMVFEILDGDWLERAQPDVQGQRCPTDLLFGEPCEQRIREVKARSSFARWM